MTRPRRPASLVSPASARADMNEYTAAAIPETRMTTSLTTSADFIRSTLRPGRTTSTSARGMSRNDLSRSTGAALGAALAPPPCMLLLPPPLPVLPLPPPLPPPPPAPPLLLM